MSTPSLAKLPPTPAELAELLEKYEVMLRLRCEHAAGVAADPRPEMLRLARRFPGALRELDELPFDVLEARSQAVATAVADPSRGEPWMEACAAFHRLMRGALAAKRWLHGRKQIDDAILADFREALPRMAHPQDAAAWTDHLAALARPPGRRVSDLVFERVGNGMGLGVPEVKALIFSPPRRLR